MSATNEIEIRFSSLPGKTILVRLGESESEPEAVVVGEKEDQAPALLYQLKRLESAASRVTRYGATPGPQWVGLTKALISARAVIDRVEEEEEGL